MFEHSDVPGRKRPLSFWLKIGAAVVFLLVIANAVRINREELPVVTGPDVRVDRFTEKGDIVRGLIEVPAGDFLSYRFELPHRFTLKGRFQRIRRKDRITFHVLAEENFHLWKEGREFKFATSTGKVPAGEITRVLEAGTYYIVFDNRDESTASVALDANFEIQ